MNDGSGEEVFLFKFDFLCRVSGQLYLSPKMFRLQEQALRPLNELISDHAEFDGVFAGRVDRLQCLINALPPRQPRRKQVSQDL